MVGVLFGLFCIQLQKNFSCEIFNKFRLSIVLSVASLFGIILYILIISNCNSQQACIDLNSYIAFLPVSALHFWASYFLLKMTLNKRFGKGIMVGYFIKKAKQIKLAKCVYTKIIYNHVKCLAEFYPKYRRITAF
jgi:hypothetical protein